jgi:hypothetical protein
MAVDRATPLMALLRVARKRGSDLLLGPSAAGSRE